jgi:Flp pilus assembly protein TadG
MNTRRDHPEQGQALVELALVLPLFLLLIAGAMWFGPQAYASNSR